MGLLVPCEVGHLRELLLAAFVRAHVRLETRVHPDVFLERDRVRKAFATAVVVARVRLHTSMRSLVSTQIGTVRVSLGAACVRALQRLLTRVRADVVLQLRPATELLVASGALVLLGRLHTRLCDLGAGVHLHLLHELALVLVHRDGRDLWVVERDISRGMCFGVRLTDACKRLAVHGDRLAIVADDTGRRDRLDVSIQLNHRVLDVIADGPDSVFIHLAEIEGVSVVIHLTHCIWLVLADDVHEPTQVLARQQRDLLHQSLFVVERHGLDVVWVHVLASGGVHVFLVAARSLGVVRELLRVSCSCLSVVVGVRRGFKTVGTGLIESGVVIGGIGLIYNAAHAHGREERADGELTGRTLLQHRVHGRDRSQAAKAIDIAQHRTPGGLFLDAGGHVGVAQRRVRIVLRSDFAGGFGAFEQRRLIVCGAVGVAGVILGGRLVPETLALVRLEGRVPTRNGGGDGGGRGSGHRGCVYGLVVVDHRPRGRRGAGANAGQLVRERAIREARARPFQMATPPSFARPSLSDHASCFKHPFQTLRRKNVGSQSQRSVARVP